MDVWEIAYTRYSIYAVARNKIKTSANTALLLDHGAMGLYYFDAS